jgi:hypothetical protein
VTSLLIGRHPSRALAHPPSPYPSWTPASDKPPKRGGILTRASATDPPVLDPRLTNSVGLFQVATLTYNRLLGLQALFEVNLRLVTTDYLSNGYDGLMVTMAYKPV